MTLSLILSGCSQNVTTTLVACDIHQRDDSRIYMYDANGDFYSYSENENNIYQIPDVGLIQKPALMVPVVNYKWELTEELPSRYKGNIFDISGYTKELGDIGFSSTYLSSSSAMLEIIMSDTDTYLRIIYMPNDLIRIYAQKSDGTACNPPLLD